MRKNTNAVNIYKKGKRVYRDQIVDGKEEISETFI